eukprot:GHVT01104960.1.p1 GENE.GHVT01104960.1~~GHVT01104960.1.p1  ORF type:complete len:494 (+),score=63.93 GHVT01104960.1:191-1483(+)
MQVPPIPSAGGQRPVPSFQSNYKNSATARRSFRTVLPTPMPMPRRKPSLRKMLVVGGVTAAVTGITVAALVGLASMKKKDAGAAAEAGEGAGAQPVGAVAKEEASGAGAEPVGAVAKGEASDAAPIALAKPTEADAGKDTAEGKKAAEGTAPGKTEPDGTELGKSKDDKAKDDKAKTEEPKGDGKTEPAVDGKSSGKAWRQSEPPRVVGVMKQDPKNSDLFAAPGKGEIEKPWAERSAKDINIVAHDSFKIVTHKITRDTLQTQQLNGAKIAHFYLGGTTQSEVDPKTNEFIPRTQDYTRPRKPHSLREELQPYHVRNPSIIKNKLTGVKSIAIPLIDFAHEQNWKKDMTRVLTKELEEVDKLIKAGYKLAVVQKPKDCKYDIQVGLGASHASTVVPTEYHDMVHKFLAEVSLRSASHDYAQKATKPARL